MGSHWLPKKSNRPLYNEAALCREETNAVRDNTSTITQGWGDYIRAELDLTMGFMTVLMGWEDTSHALDRCHEG